MLRKAAMDDTSFKARVDKIFGSLPSCDSPSLHHEQPPLWSIADAEVERREWRREGGGAEREELLCSSSYGELLKEDRRFRSLRNFRKELDDGLDDLDDEEGEEASDGDSNQRRSDIDVDEWGIRSFIGMDRTLDNEEEEDVYDKVALGRENPGERLYMKDVVDQGCSLNSKDVLQNALPFITEKDPRANHMAARMRLKEDDGEAYNLNSHHHSATEAKKQLVEASDASVQLKSILKRNNNDAGSKSQKRVKFDPACICKFKEASERTQEICRETFSLNTGNECAPAEDVSGVPDYILHPARYTCYTFDSSSDIDEESNKKACFDFLNLVQASKSVESGSNQENGPHDLTKPVIFTPKKNVGGRGSEAKPKGDGCKQSEGTRLSIAAGKVQDSDANAAEDDSEANLPNGSVVIQKVSLGYRTKSMMDDDDGDS